MARNYWRMAIAFFLLTLMVIKATGQLDEVVKGCPFTSIYGFGETTSSHTVINNLALAFHLPSPPTYLNNGKFINYGVDFSSATNSLDAQIELFKNYIHNHCSPSTNHECSKNIKKGIFVIGEVGANVYKHAFSQGKPIKEVSGYVPNVVQSIKQGVEKLIQAGARNLVIPGSLPLGCLPSSLTRFKTDNKIYYDSDMCLRGLNTFSVLHNNHLRQALMELRRDYPSVQIVYADFYTAFMELFRNRVLLGFSKTSLNKACCGTGAPYNFDEKNKCGDENVPVCSDPTKYIHWDGFQLTEEAYKDIVQGFISGDFLHPKLKLPVRRHCLM